jgi:hypothetical protein
MLRDMVDVTSMSRNREIVSEPLPMAAICKASRYRVVGDRLDPDHNYIEATPRAVWSRRDPFEAYRPVLHRAHVEEGAPHLRFAKLADRALELAPTDEEARLFHEMVRVFADLYGLLGLLWEEFNDVPLLPEREVGWFVRVAPDAEFDRSGRLRSIDPATEGKRLLEELLREDDRQIYAKRGELHLWEPEKYVLTQEMLILPGELRFQKRATDFLRSGFSRRFSSRPNEPRVFTYEEVQRRYGIRVVSNPQTATGVSIISTREPLTAWRDELRSFAQPRSPERVNRHLVGVNPREVVGNGGASSWYCPSLLKALWFMRHLDVHGGTMIKKCQAPGCPNYFRVGPHGDTESIYCPPLPGEKQSKCASRASSAMYRERQRGMS